MECFVGSATNAVAPASSGEQARLMNPRPVDEETAERGMIRTFSSLQRSSLLKVTSPLDTNNIRLKSAALQRKLSAFQSSVQATSPNLAIRHGSLCSYLYAPHPSPGKGLCFSPNGELFIRYGFSPEVKLMRTHDCSVINTLKGSPGHVRFANFSTDGKFLMAASDGKLTRPVFLHAISFLLCMHARADCHVLIYSVEDAVAGIMSEMANIDVGQEPVAFCLLSPDGKVLLSCDDDGQLETWSPEKGTHMIKVPSIWLKCEKYAILTCISII